MKQQKTVRILAILIIVALIFVVGGNAWLNHWAKLNTPKSFPQVEGELTLPGLDAPVDIYRDSMGVPYIYASTLHDLFMAQGYVHAQERFWQMDFWRHVGAGRLSEMFGKGQLDTDKFLRTLGWEKTSQEEWEALSDESKSILEAYTEGVNAYLEGRSGTEISLEYGVLKVLNSHYTPAPWTPVNSLTWGKAIPLPALHSAVRKSGPHQKSDGGPPEFQEMPHRFSRPARVVDHYRRIAGVIQQPIDHDYR